MLLGGTMSIISDDGGFTDNNTHTMVNNKPRPMVAPDEFLPVTWTRMKCYTACQCRPSRFIETMCKEMPEQSCNMRIRPYNHPTLVAADQNP